MLNYKILMTWNPELLLSRQNEKNQIIDFYQCPIDGKKSPIIAVCAELKLSAYTNFYDLDNFGVDSQFLPVFSHACIWSQWEAPNRINKSNLSIFPRK